MTDNEHPHNGGGTARSDLELMADVLRSARLIRELLKETDKYAFAQDVMRRQAVSGRLILISARVKALSGDFKNRYRQIPWGSLVNMGNEALRDRSQPHPHDIHRFCKVTMPRLILAGSGIMRQDRKQ